MKWGFPVWKFLVRAERACTTILQEYCPCEETCSNQMFTKKQYAKIEKVCSCVHLFTTLYN